MENNQNYTELEIIRSQMEQFKEQLDKQIAAGNREAVAQAVSAPKNLVAAEEDDTDLFS